MSCIRIKVVELKLQQFNDMAASFEAEEPWSPTGQMAGWAQTGLDMAVWKKLQPLNNEN
jgi:hypothetical protein